MVEGTKLTGVADAAATVSAGLLATSSVLAILSLMLPWWTGTTTVGTLASQQAVESSITLWSFDLTVGTQVPDGAGGTKLETVKQDMTWDQMCAITAESLDGAPPACGQIEGVRAFVILTIIAGLPGVGALVQSRTVSPLLLLLGAVLGLLTGFLAIIGIVMGATTSTSGMQGGGVISLLAAMLVAFVSVCAALYAAGIAMPAEAPPPPKRFTRSQKVKEQNEKDAEMGRALEARKNSRHLDNAANNEAGSDDGESVDQKKAPVMLTRVLYWSQEHAGEADAESIPVELLEMAFREIDDDGSGQIELVELVDNLALCGLNASMEATRKVMMDIDKNMSGDIDIHEFVEFFKQLEELDRFQARTKQRAQFAQFLCNFCFIAHIIIVSVLLMQFIGMEPSADPDNYLIMQNMLMAFSAVLCILLIFVICIPAARLTIGANIEAWERQYQKERMARLAAKPSMDEPQDDGKSRQAAWGAKSSGGATGLTEFTVNSAQFGSSYRVSKQNQFLADAAADMEGLQADRSLRRGSRLSSKSSRISSRSSTMRQAAIGGGDAPGAPALAASGVLTTMDGNMERYDPDAYRQAAMASMQNPPASSFSPMQVRDMDMPHEEPQMPGNLALQDGMPSPVSGGLTGTGFYQREL